MKKFFPLFLLVLASAILLGGLIFRDKGPVDLTPYAVGDMAGFVVFDAPKALPETPFFNRSKEFIRLGDFEGKTVLVNFWATWCEPCKEEMPALARLQEAMMGKNFEVITISVDWQGYRVIDNFFDAYGIKNLPAYWDSSNKLPNELENVGLPMTILIDEKGRWLGRKDGPLAWDSADSIAMMEAATQP